MLEKKKLFWTRVPLRSTKHDLATKQTLTLIISSCSGSDSGGRVAGINEKKKQTQQQLAHNYLVRCAVLAVMHFILERAHGIQTCLFFYVLFLVACIFFNHFASITHRQPKHKSGWACLQRWQMTGVNKRDETESIMFHSEQSGSINTAPRCVFTCTLILCYSHEGAAPFSADAFNRACYSLSLRLWEYYRKTQPSQGLVLKLTSCKKGFKWLVAQKQLYLECELVSKQHVNQRVMSPVFSG